MLKGILDRANEALEHFNTVEGDGRLTDGIVLLRDAIMDLETLKARSGGIVDDLDELSVSIQNKEIELDEIEQVVLDTFHDLDNLLFG